jgi:hypothetical protein
MEEMEMYFMQISKHSPESCPTINEKYRKPTMDLMAKNDELLAKHGVKLAGMWNDHPGHVVYNIYEAPNLQAFMAYQMEPECMAWTTFNTIDTKVVLGPDEIKAMFKM